MAHSQPESASLEWQPGPNGVWERHVDEIEIFYKCLAKGDRFHPVTATASFKTLSSGGVKDDEEAGRSEAALRKAWIALRWKHPSLGSRIEHDSDTGRWKRVYPPLAGSHELDNWVRLAFRVVDADGSADRWCHENSTISEFATLLLVRSDGEGEAGGRVFLQCPHDVTDGVGALQLINQLFEQAALAYEQGGDHALPEWGRETARLSPCLRIAVDIPASLSGEQVAQFQEIQAQNTALYSHPCLLSLPSSSESSQGRIQRRVVSVTKETTDNILGRCKLIGPGVTVTNMFTAALAVALAELQPQKEERYPVRYVNHSMINLRPFCRAPYDSRDHAAAAYHTVSAQALGIDLFVPGSNEEKPDDMTPSVARSVRDFYQSIRPNAGAEEPHEQVVFAPSVFKAITPPSGVNPHAVSSPPFCPVPLSSLGRIDTMVTKSHGPFNLTSVSAFSEPIGAGVALFLGSWDGKMELSSLFNSQYHDPLYVEEFLRCIMNCVYRGLGIVDGR